MTVTNDVLKAAAQRVWPNAKRIDVSPGSAAHVVLSGSDPVGTSVVAIDYDDNVIGQAHAKSSDALKIKLDGMLPDGGQAP